MRTARCCCGACEITVEGEPALNAICHCDNCKRRTGSAFGWSAYFPDAAIVAQRGETSLYELRTGRRSFCPACGTTLYWRSSGFMDGQVGVAAGCFTDDPLPAPNITATDARRCAWVTLPDGWLTSP